MFGEYYTQVRQARFQYFLATKRSLEEWHEKTDLLKSDEGFLLAYTDVILLALKRTQLQMQ
ncbi:MAG: hypothetical protein NPIRA02_16130 [Nitrospirales bacterium]|nr:MAG: hypothetical protein NPIRA02_16130 [Nitrospirales bacterium]